jgi:hypothetical protein
MRHETTIAIRGNDDLCDKKSTIHQLQTIKKGYFGEKNKHYLSLKIAGEWIHGYDREEDEGSKTDAEWILPIHEEFDRLIKFINEYGYDTKEWVSDNGEEKEIIPLDEPQLAFHVEKEGFLEASKDYLTDEFLGIEEGDLEFDNSFNLSNEFFMLYLGTDIWLADEEEELPDLGLGLIGEMNDYQEEYFDFQV